MRTSNGHRRRLLGLNLLLIGVGLPSSSYAQPQIGWTQGPMPGPIARIEDTMVWDSVNHRMVMLGGYDLNWNRQNDTWEYNGATRVWTNVTPASNRPPRRSGQAMAYDPVRQVIIVFGGLNEAGVWINDTWEWSCVSKSWTNVSPGGSPSPRQGARLVHDAANDRLLLFGGVDQNQFFAQTWIWNLSARTWTLLATTSTSPTGRPFVGRTFHGMAYHTGNGRTTIYGGIGFPQGGTTVVDFADTWELQGTVWTDVTPAGTSPPGRGWTQLVFDPPNGRMVLYGGFHGGVASDQDTWAWNGATWTLISNPSPPGLRDSHAMAYDTVRQKVVLFGGYLADVWELTGNTWAMVLTTTWPPAQERYSLAHDTARNEVVLYGSGSLETWEYRPASGTWVWYYVPGPNQRIGHAMAYQTAQARMVLFGGRQRVQAVESTVLGDTWQWNPANKTWTNVTPGGSPPARYDHSMVYDAARNQIVLFGGRNAAGTPLGDTWLWNGSTWTAAAGGPAARYGHAMAYNAARGVVVLFGGENGSQKLGDTWEWNGSSWTLMANSGPSARSFAALSPAGAGNPGVVLFGGSSSSGTLLNDAWFWAGSGWGPYSPSPGPTPRQAAEMVFVDSAGQFVLFGGRDANGISGELWRGAVSAIVPSLSVGDCSVTEGAAGTTPCSFVVSLSTATSQTVTVTYATVDGSAVAASDYNAVSGTLTFPPGTTSQPVSAGVRGDLVDEPNETFFIDLGAATGATIGDALGVSTIFDDDPTPTLNIGDCSIAEGPSGQTVCQFPVTLSGASSSTITVSFTTANGSALAGSDYIATNGSLTFPPLTTSRTISVAVLGDRLTEPQESYSVNLSGPSNAVLGDASGLGTILNDDSPWRIVGTGDFNLDTRSDILWRHELSGDIVMWFMNGANLSSGTLTTPPALTDTNWKIVGTGLFNAGPNPDILWRHDVSGQNVVWFMNGAVMTGGTFANPAVLADPNWKMAGTGHFNGDGQVDILWRHQISGEIVVWFMNGVNMIGGQFTNPSSLDPAWKFVATGDFNQDGKADIVLRHTNGNIFIWLMDGATLMGGGPTSPPTLDVGWQIVGTVDFNLDGKPDLLLRHDNGSLFHWLMDGLTLIGGGPLNPPSLF